MCISVWCGFFLLQRKDLRAIQYIKNMELPGLHTLMWMNLFNEVFCAISIKVIGLRFDQNIIAIFLFATFFWFTLSKNKTKKQLFFSCMYWNLKKTLDFWKYCSNKTKKKRKWIIFIVKISFGMIMTSQNMECIN